MPRPSCILRRKRLNLMSGVRLHGGSIGVPAYSNYCMEYASKTRYTFGRCCVILFDSASGTGALGTCSEGAIPYKGQCG